MVFHADERTSRQTHRRVCPGLIEVIGIGQFAKERPDIGNWLDDVRNCRVKAAPFLLGQDEAARQRLSQCRRLGSVMNSVYLVLPMRVSDTVTH